MPRMDKSRLRSKLWFDNPENPGMTALYLERYLNYGLTRGGAAVRQADHRHRADRLRPFALQPPPSRARQARARRHHARPAASPSNSRSTRSRRPASGRPPRSTATSPISAWSRCSVGYPLDGVVLTTGCDKTTPACIMAAATVNLPAIVLSGGPMLNGWCHGRAQRLRHRRVEGARAARRGRRSTTSSSSRSSPPRRPRSAIATPWARPRR